MGKSLISQRKGKGSIFKAISFNYPGKICYPSMNNKSTKGVVKDLIHSPGHNAPLAIIELENKEQIMIPAYYRMKKNEIIEYNQAKQKKGITQLGKISEGTTVFNIEKNPGEGGKYVRTSGTSAKIITQTEKGVIIQMPSKKKKTFNPRCRATIGIIAGAGRTAKPLMKAGNNYKKQKAKHRVYPKVRGLAMNSVSHPHGGTSTKNKGKPLIAKRFAPPGRKVGSIRPKRTGMKR